MLFRSADLFQWLKAQPDGAYEVLFCCQAIEHLPPLELPQFIRDCSAKLEKGGVLILETPNPECLAIFATHFYLDPTHHRPVPPILAAFHIEEAGLGRIEVKRLAPAIDSMPSLASLPADFRKAFFGCFDYAIVDRNLWRIPPAWPTKIAKLFTNCTTTSPPSTVPPPRPSGNWYGKSPASNGNPCAINRLTMAATGGQPDAAGAFPF